MKRKRFIGLLTCLALAAGLLSLAACAGEDKPAAEADGKLIVAVSIVPERTFVEAVCGDLVDVVTLIPPGSSPENYEPTPAEMEKFADAAVYFTIGVPTEAANILPSAGDVKVVSLQDEVSKIYADRTFEAGERDPHIWLSPKRVQVMIDVIARELAALDPDNTEAYNKNATAYKAELDAADAQLREALSGVRDKAFIVYHPAFGYFADDYGLTMYALEEEGKEATAEHLQEVIDIAKADNAKVIFYQAEIDSSQSEAFAEEIGGKTMQLEPLSPDYIENLKAMAQIMAEVMQ